MKGAALVGAIRAMERYDIVAQLKGVAGTSVGAIVMGLLACGLDSTALAKALHTDFSTFLRDTALGPVTELLADLQRFGRRYGFNSGKRMYEWLLDLTGGKCMNDLPLDLRVYAVMCTPRWELVEFSPDSHPDLLVADVLRASASLPFVFTPWPIDGALYVDGGLRKNFPVDAFQAPDHTLGLLLDEGPEPELPRENAPLVFIGSFINAMTNMAQSALPECNLDSEPYEVVHLPTLGVGAGDFHTPEWKLAELDAAGDAAAMAYLGAMEA